MAYADQLLAGGEQIVRREQQHWVFPFLIAGRWVVIALVIGVVGFLLSWFVLQGGGEGFFGSIVGFIDQVIGWATALALLFALGGFIWSIVQWRTQEYVLTSQRVMHIRGVLNKQSSDSSLENITDAQITIPWLGRMLGFGDLKFMTASEAGIEDLRALHDPIGFKKALMEAKTERMIDVNTARMPTPPVRVEAPAPAPAPVPAPAPAPAPPAEPPAAAQTAEDVTKTLASLAALRDSGAITPEEFEAKKTELLDRI